jgi:hypothetical protein
MTDRLKQLERERQAVEAKIREAFRGVTRTGGITWSESVILDGDGSGRTREQARALDTESRWEDLVDDKDWHHEVGIGGFNFLDPIGFRYYIAPAMIRCIRENGGEFISYALRIDGEFKRDLVSLFDARQSHATARFVRLMIAVHVTNHDDIYGKPWSDAYKIYWKKWDKGTPLD